MINNIKTYSFFILILLIAHGQTVFAQELSEPPVITSLTVKPLPSNPGSVEIFWTDSRSISIGYIVLKNNPNPNKLGFHPYDTVYAPLQQYIDSSANGNEKSEGYKIQSFTEIINGEIFGTSENSEPSYTIFLNKIEFDSCQMTNTLRWNHYIGWVGGAFYNIINGEGEIIIDGYTDTVLTLTNIQTETNYIYYIRAVRNTNPSFKSVSNIDSVYTNPIKQPNPENFYLNNITYNGSTAYFTALIDTSADLLGHTLMASYDNNTFAQVAFKSIDKNTPTIEFSHDTVNQPLFYKINAIGVCHDTVLSTQVVQPIVLTAPTSTETEVTLKWNMSFIESSEIYELTTRVDNGDPFLLPPPSGTETTIQFNNLGTETSEVFCFKVKATDNKQNHSESNDICVSRIPKIEVPTAFSPNSDGLNDYFGPFWEEGNENSYIKNAIVEEIKLIIYDKYGGAVFSTDKTYKRWAGDVKGKYVHEGGYIYYLWFKTAQQKTYEKSGTINVVYP